MFLIERLVWDPGNIRHVAGHAVTPGEVEAVCHSDPLTEFGKYGRLLVIGPTGTNRILTVVLDPEGPIGTYYVVTARPASRRERHLYRIYQEEGNPE